MIKLLLEKGVKINGGLGVGVTPLFFAVDYYPESITFLLVMGAIVDARSSCGRTPFLEACRLNKIDAKEYLSKAGAYIEAFTNDGTTPFLASVRSGAEEAMHWLIDRGANIHARDHRKRSAHWWGNECKHSRVAEFLSAKGVN